MLMCKCFRGISLLNLMDLFTNILVLTSDILHFVFYGSAVAMVKSFREEDRFIHTDTTIGYYWLLLYLGTLILIFNAITFIKVLILWLPEKFGIIITLTINFLNFKTFYLVLWNTTTLFVPTVVAYLLLNSQVNGFTSLIFVLARVNLLSQGGWLFNCAVHLGIKENLATLLATIPIVYIYFIVALCLLLSQIITGIIISFIMDLLRKSRVSAKTLQTRIMEKDLRTATIKVKNDIKRQKQTADHKDHN